MKRPALALAWAFVLAGLDPAGAAVPTGATLMQRVETQKVPLPVVGAAISRSGSWAGAAQQLESLGLLKPGEFQRGSSADEETLRFALHRVWFDAAKATPAPYEIDASWPVPALVVRDAERTYYVHGVTHGFGVAPNARQVRRLVARLERSGRPLYSEQNLPAHYGYSYGREMLDHSLPVAARDASESEAAATGQLAIRALGSAALAAAGVWTILHPSVQSLVAVLALAAARYSGDLHLFLRRLTFLNIGRKAQRRGDADQAAYWRDFAKAVYARRPDWTFLRRVYLPAPLRFVEGIAGDPDRAARSRGMAHLVAAETETLGYSVAHMIVGINHAVETVGASGGNKGL